MSITVDSPTTAATHHPRIDVGVSVAGQDPAALVRDHGSPLYVYDLDVVTDRVEMLRAALPGAVEVAYAVKANPSPAILRRLASLGVGADIASAGELAAVTRAGFDMRRVMFTGPGKTDAELGAAIRAGVRAITVESLDELDVLLELAPLAGRHQGLVLRLTAEEMSRGAEGTPIIGAGGASKFGLLRDELDEAVDRLLLAGAIGGQGSPYSLLGLHAFGASNVRDADRLVEGIRWIAAQAEDVARAHGQRFGLIDAGGGLGIPYADDETPLDLGRFGRGVADEIATWQARAGLADAHLLLEPGRFLVGPAGAYLTRVVRTKNRGGRTMAITDGGIHHLLRPALVGESQRIVAVGDAASRGGDTPASVVGPLCTGLDVLATEVSLPTPHTGDLLAVLDAGAYGFTESMPLFLSHPVPAELAVSDGIVRVARLRQEPSAGPPTSIW
jgi:diaminopimelate decarboxylase